MMIQWKLFDYSGCVFWVFNFDYVDGWVIIYIYEDVELVMDVVCEICNGYCCVVGVYMRMFGSILVMIVNKWCIDDGVDVMCLLCCEFFVYVWCKFNGDYFCF